MKSKFKFLALAFVVLLIQASFQPTAFAATAGTGICQQTYTLTAGSESATVTSSGNYCYVAFKNLGAASSTSSSYTWSKPTGVSSLDVLVIGGGGGGGARHGGGGGAGSFVQATSYAVASSATNISVVVGSGGVGANGPGGVYVGTKGNESSFKIGANGLTALGGGAGQNGYSSNVNGGSGGGAGASQTPGNPTRSTQKTLDGVSTLNGIEFGETGTSGVSEPASFYDYWAAGGGGGAGGVGKRPSWSGTEYTVSNSLPDGDGSLARGGDGGIGKVSSFISTTIATNLGIGQNSSGSAYFAAGGGGGIGADGAAGGVGGIGGGGNGTKAIASGGVAALTSTGSGGGGSGFDDISPVAGDVANPPGGAGGSGIVVIRYIPVLPSVSVTVASGDFNFRTPKSISATPTVDGKITFRANNLIIPGCKNLSAIANVARSCSYRPSTRGDVSISVTVVPTDSGFSSSTTRTATYFVLKRSGARTR
jgi:hypothetical protein